MAETQTKPKAKPRQTRSKRAVEKVARSYYEAMAALFREIVSAVPDVETRMERMVADTQRAAIEWRLSGHFNGGPFQGIEPTGRPIQLRGLDLLEVEGDKLKRGSVYYDGAEFARQVGMLPAQDSGAERAMKGAVNAVTRARKALNERRGM